MSAPYLILNSLAEMQPYFFPHFQKYKVAEAEAETCSIEDIIFN